VEHEGRAGELLAVDVPVAPAAAEMVGHQPGHGTSKVGVDHQRIGLVNAGSRAHAHGAAALEENLLDIVIERDGGTQVKGGPRHHRGDRPAAAQRMEDPILIFKKRKNGEKARAVEGRHPQVFDLKVNARRVRRSSKYRLSSPSSDSQGRSRGSTFRSWGESRSRHPRKGDSRTLRNSFILLRLSAMNL